MARRRCITEMGMGVDVHGKDATKAAKRAVSDAIRHSSLSFVRLFGKTPHDMFVDVTVGVPDPAGVDTQAVAKELPYGTVTVTAVKGGLEIPAEQGGEGASEASQKSLRGESPDCASPSAPRNFAHSGRADGARSSPSSWPIPRTIPIAMMPRPASSKRPSV